MTTNVTIMPRKAGWKERESAALHAVHCQPVGGVSISKYSRSLRGEKEKVEGGKKIKRKGVTYH